MNILLTGATGFVGSHLLDQLLADGHVVHALVRNPKKIEIQNQNLNLIKIDLDHPFQLEQEIIKNLEVVIHTAGLVHTFNDQDFYDVNTKGTQYLIEALKQNTKLKFILISSLAARGPYEKLEVDQPVSHYGKSKKEAENLLIATAPESWIKIIIRPPMVIGPKDTAVLDIFKMIQDGFVLLPGTKAFQKQYSFVNVFDLVATIKNSIRLNQDALLYSTFDEIITFEKLMKTIQNQMMKKFVIYLPIPQIIILMFAKTLFYLNRFFPQTLRMTPDKTNELFPDKWICDNGNCKRLLDQKFQFDLDQTIAMTLKDYRQRKWIK